MTGRVSSPHCVGRNEELAALARALERAAVGNPSAVLIEGEAGVGKTRLVSEFGNRARSQGSIFLMGACIPLAQGRLPYGPVHDALSRLGADRPRGLPGAVPGADADVADETGARQSATGTGQSATGTGQNATGTGHNATGTGHNATGTGHNATGTGQNATGTGQNATAQPREPPHVDLGLGQLRFFDEMLALLERLGRSHPVVLALEDLHWSDPSTFDLMTFLIRNLGSERALLIGTFREEAVRAEPLASWLAENLRHARSELLRLRRFNRSEVTEQITNIRGSALAPDLVDEIFVRSDGNPFFTEELVAVSDDVGGAALPPTVRQMAAVRIASLSELGREVVKVTAVGGRTVRDRLLREIVPLEDEEFYAGLRDAVDGYILVPEGREDSLAFRHALVREAVYDDLLPAQRRDVHRRFALILSRHPELRHADAAGSAAELAHHWYMAGDARPALRWAVRAGRAAVEAYGFAEASLHFGRALDLWGRVPDAPAVAQMDRPTLLGCCAEACHLFGEDERAIALVEDALEEAAAGSDPMRAALLYERLGWYHFTLWRGEPAFDAFRAALGLVPTEPPTTARAAILNSLGGCGYLCGRLGEAKALCEEALELSVRIGARSEEGRALQTLGYVRAELGQFDHGLANLRAAVAIAEEVADLDALARAHASLAYATGLAGRPEESLGLAIDGLEVVRRMGLERQYGTVLRYLEGQALLLLGRWDDLEEALQDSPKSGMGEVGRLMVASAHAIGRGQFERARDLLARGSDFIDYGFRPLWKTGLLENEAELAIWEGRIDAARAAVARGLDILAGTDEEMFTGRLLWLGLRTEADAAEGARVVKDTAAAAASVERGRLLMDRVAQFDPHPLDERACRHPDTAALAATCEAETCRLEGRPRPHSWGAAVAAWEALGYPYPAAYCGWQLARSRLAAGDGRAAVAAALGKAFEAARALSATPLCSQIEILAGAAGIDLGPRDEPAATRSAMATLGLTRRELQVLSLVMERRSNPEIARALYIAPKTVSAHLSHIFDKLGVHDRIAAAEEARRRGFIPIRSVP